MSDCCLTVCNTPSCFLWCELSSEVGSLLCYMSQHINPEVKKRKWHMLLLWKDLNSQHVISWQLWLQHCMGSFPATFQVHFDVWQKVSLCVLVSCLCVCDKQAGSQGLCFHAPGLTLMTVSSQTFKEEGQIYCCIWWYTGCCGRALVEGYFPVSSAGWLQTLIYLLYV